MILRLALRSLAIRPWRTAVLAAGFGLGIAVMVALLGVGEVIIEQAHAPALLGGGDLAVAGAFGPVDSARFVLSNVLGSPELRSRQVAASPTRRTTLYLIKPGMSVPVAVRGGIPSLERAVGDPEVAGVSAWTDEPADTTWSNPRPDDVLRAMDRFHQEPQRQQAVRTEQGTGNQENVASGFSRTSWAEWLYFNGRTADGRLRFYLTFLAGPTIADRRRMAVVRLQLDRGGRSTTYSAAATVDADALLDRAPDLDVAGNHVRLESARYRLTLALTRERDVSPQSAVLSPQSEVVNRQSAVTGREPGEIVGEILLDAPPGRSLPPAAIHGARGWVSGYVVPVLSGAVHGRLQIGHETLSLDGASGYHDHNWGFWEGVRWQWGQVAGGDVSIVFGRVFPPAAVADLERVPGFLGVLGPGGPIAFSTDVTIAEHADAGTPREITVEARGQRLDLRMTLSVEESVSTRMPLTRLADGGSMNFLQLGGVYRVDGRAGDRALAFTARGAAETFGSNR